MTDTEIIKALECEANEKVCIHEQYEEACGLWCKHLHKWCADMGGKNEKNNCSAFKPATPNKRAKATLDLINRQKAEIDGLKKLLSLSIDTQNEFSDIITTQKEEIERLKDHNKQLRYDRKQITSEAIKEFADELKKETRGLIGTNFIDGLVKELIGGE